MALSEDGRVQNLMNLTQMKIGRSSHGCAIVNSRKNGKKFLVVAGGKVNFKIKYIGSNSIF